MSWTRLDDENWINDDDGTITNVRPLAPRRDPDELILCQGLVTDPEGNLVKCGTPFIRERGIDECCSLPCWQLASERRIRAENGEWDWEFSGHTNDPMVDDPELYAYKGWT